MHLLHRLRAASSPGREALTGAGIGTACALAVLVFGVLLWDNYWYTGTYPLVTYSVLAPALSALIGVAVLVVACTAASGALFAVLATREWGRDARWPSPTNTRLSSLPT